MTFEIIKANLLESEEDASTHSNFTPCFQDEIADDSVENDGKDNGDDENSVSLAATMTMSTTTTATTLTTSTTSSMSANKDETCSSNDADCVKDTETAAAELNRSPEDEFTMDESIESLSEVNTRIVSCFL